MARSVRRNSNSNSNRRTNKNTKKSKKSQNRNQRRNKSQKRNRSQRRRNRSQRRNKNKKGGALPAYRLHEEQGFLNRINPHAHALPLTYEGDHVVENHSNQYSISH